MQLLNFLIQYYVQKQRAHSHAIDVTGMHAMAKIDDLSSELIGCKMASAVSRSSMRASLTYRTGTHMYIQA